MTTPNVIPIIIAIGISVSGIAVTGRAGVRLELLARGVRHVAMDTRDVSRCAQ